MKIFKFLSFLIFKGFGAILTFLYIFVSTKILTPTQYGVFALLITIIMMGSAVLSFGIPAFFYEIESSQKRKNEINKILKYLSNIIFIIAFSVFLILFLLSHPISQNLFKSNEYSLIIKLLGIFILFGIINRIFSSYFIASGKYIISTIGDNFLFQIFIIVLLYFFKILENLSFLDFLTYLLFFLPAITMFNLFFVNINFNFIFIKTSLSKYFEYLKPCLELSLVTISGIILISSDIIILGIMSKPENVSNYHIATKFAAIITLIYTASSTFYYGKIIKMYKEKKLDNLKNLFLRANLYSSLSSFILIIIILLSFGHLVNLFFFDLDKQIIFYLILFLCIGQFINIIFGFQGSMIVIIPELRRQISILFIITVIINIIFNVIGFKIFGTLGIALATMLSITFREIYISCYFKKYYNFHPLNFLKNLNYLK